MVGMKAVDGRLVPDTFTQFQINDIGSPNQATHQVFHCIPVEANMIQDQTAERDDHD
jgi:hypothetical protein